jgi:hypothetical protein
MVTLILRTRKVHWFVPLSLMAYFLTFYTFSDQYAARIQIIFSIFVVATVIFGLRRLRISRIVWMTPIIAIVLFTMSRYYSKTIVDYFNECRMYRRYQQAGIVFRENMREYLEPNRFIFCGDDTYLRYIMPFFPAHSLAAYRSLDYFQLKADLSDELYRDYVTALQSDDYGVIDSIAVKYNINTAVIARREMDIPLFQTLTKYWQRVYADRNFIILRKPAG